MIIGGTGVEAFCLRLHLGLPFIGESMRMEGELRMRHKRSYTTVESFLS